MPHRMCKVYEDIHAHPFYNQDTNKALRFGVAVAESGLSWRTSENNKWMREIWRYMYAGGPRPEQCDDWPEICPQTSEE